MKKRLILSMLVVGLLALGGQGFAVLPATDNVPAATLLLPYFEVDLVNAGGVTTLFTIGNASAAPTVAHLTVWSDWSIPVFDFDIYLTGYDIQSINLRDVLVNGTLPETGFGFSNVGAFSITGTNPTAPPPAGAVTCGTTAGQPPRYTQPQSISPGFLQHIAAWLTGQASPLTFNCASSGDQADPDLAIGYITIDNANACSLLFPSDANYFAANGTGVANNINQLFGDYFIVDALNAFATGDALVSVEAQDLFVGGLNSYTFYGRYTTPTFVDNREPLGTVWLSRHVTTPPFTGGASVLVWRDATIVSGLTGVTCGTAPSWFPLDQRQLVIFDEDENPVVPAGGVSGEPQAELLPFPNETQRVSVGGSTLPLAPGFENGFLWLNLNHGPNNVNPFAVIPYSAQAWVVTNLSAFGLFSVGFDAVTLDNATDPFQLIIGPP